MTRMRKPNVIKSHSERKQTELNNAQLETTDSEIEMTTRKVYSFRNAKATLFTTK